MARQTKKYVYFVYSGKTDFYCQLYSKKREGVYLDRDLAMAERKSQRTYDEDGDIDRKTYIVRYPLREKVNS